MCRVPAAPATQDIRRATRPHLKSPGPEFQGSGGEEQLQQHQLSRSGAVTSDQQLIGNIKTSHRLGIFISGGLCFEDDKDHDFLFPMVKTSLLLFICLRLFSTLVGSSAAKLMMAALPPTQAAALATHDSPNSGQSLQLPGRLRCFSPLARSKASWAKSISD